jgi:large subunit ribosomal protein L15e
MGAYKYIKESFQQQYGERSDVMRKRLSTWNNGPAIARVDKPMNVARARELGYKDKQGVVVVRIRIRKGMSKRAKARGGRKPSKSGRFFARKKSIQAMAEERVARMFSNCEVLNSYYVGEDGKQKYYEVMLVDKSHPSVGSDPVYSDIIGIRGRVYRGLTSAGKKHRGMSNKGGSTMVSRPSVRSARRG